MLLENKFAVVYGAGGRLGSAVADAFAREGARVFLTGRTREPLERVTKDITDTGGRADLDVVDALDEQAVDDHIRSVVARAGAVDVSVNVIARPELRGIPLADMTTADFMRPVVSGVTANFITARAAARQMTRQGSGVILALDSGSAHGSPMVGGTGPADGALDVLIRNLAAEIGPAGVRVLGIRTAGLPEIPTPKRMIGRSPTLAEVAETMTVLASDRAGAIAGTFINATSGVVAS